MIHHLFYRCIVDINIPKWGSYTSLAECYSKILCSQIKSMNWLLERLQSELCCHLLYSMSYCKCPLNSAQPAWLQLMIISTVICFFLNVLNVFLKLLNFYYRKCKWRKMSIRYLSNQHYKTKDIQFC